MRLGNDWRNPTERITTIIEYTDVKPSSNEYPVRIVSPTHPRACCATGSEPVGTPEQNHRFIFQYMRCPICGFARRLLIRELPPRQLIEQLKRSLGISFIRDSRALDG